MSYYMQGDYYRGDPFLGGLIGVGAKLISKAVPVIGRAVGIGRKVIKTVPGQVAVGTGAAVGVQAGGKALGLFGGGNGKRKKMNPLNVRALDRALRRIKGFEKRARKVGRYTNPGKPFTMKIRKKRKCA